MMAKSALWLASQLPMDVLSQHAQKGFQIHVIGHSLGAGVASLLSFVLHGSPDKVMADAVRCFGFGVPACADQQLAKLCEPFVTSVVCGHDVVPRMNLHSLAMHRKALSEFQWAEAARADLVAASQEKLADLARIGRAFVPKKVSQSNAATLATTAGKTLGMALLGGAARALEAATTPKGTTSKSKDIVDDVAGPASAPPSADPVDDEPDIALARLVVPGRIIHLWRPTGDGDWNAHWVSPDFLQGFSLSRSLLQDHICGSYGVALARHAQ
mmetsp:Transcript_59638/g.141091  ORF Transcript_59638/g.141091 Transcript_59638/m.141091 type:complete len:271 (-) Transcript_59638:42-854(-)